ncbi:MAG TPA: L,D-transpeptidase family protein [Methyloceanibacter sp.]|nr:L,D-transpeptidase family protein [Methyloceanibacter sp.]
MRPVYSIALSLFLAAPLSAPAFAAEPDAPDALITRTEAIRIAVQNRLSAKFSTTTEHKKDEKGALVEYYSVPDQKLLWVGETGLTERGRAVVAELQKADDYGLRASDYRLPDLAALGTQGTGAAEQLADAEIKISYAVLDYSYDARGGRIQPQRISKNLDPTLALPDPLEVIESISFRSDPAAYLRSFQPAQPQFELLRKKLIELRGGGQDVPAEDKPTVMIPNGPALKFGVVDSQVALLRTRLEIPEGQNPNLYDEAVLKAVKQFQADHNTAPDGVVGPGTRRVLNQPHLRNVGSPSQINAILLNMERWRWLPHDQGSFYVQVNIPEFMLRVYKDGEVFHTTRVVVGKPDKQTPIFANEMQTVVFGPYWNVPTSIKVEEIRPYVRPDGGWFGGGGWNTTVFQRHDLRIKYGGREVDPNSLDWNRVDIRNLHLYQPPGPRNVLGRVKFVFPNKHDVYMHDTPQKHLFAKEVRAESHGCMRVQNPDQLAAVIMSHDQNWSQARTMSAIENGYDQQIALHRKVPVYITYFTLRVNDDGSISTFRDLYGHDSRMAGALFGGRTNFVEADDGIVTQSISAQPRGTSRRRQNDTLSDLLQGFEN